MDTNTPRETNLNIARVNFPDSINYPGMKALLTILEKFSKLGNLSIITVDDKLSPVSKRFGLNIFCAKMCNSPDFRDDCFKAHEIGLKESIVIKDIFTYKCPFGLLESIIPVFFLNDCIGAVICGQAKCENLPVGLIDMVKSKLLKPAKTIEDNSVNKSLFDSIPTTDYTYYHDLISIIHDVVVSSVLSNFNNFLPPDNEIDVIEESGNDFSAHHKRETEINLYFLLSALNTMANLSVLHGSEQMNSLSILISEYIKSVISKKNISFISLEEEKNAILRYLNIQKIRFSDLLDYNVNLPLNIKDCLIPIDTISPFVERIFTLGYSTKSSKLRVGIVFKKEKNSIVIEINDNIAAPSTAKGDANEYLYINSYEIKVIDNRILNSTKRLHNLFNDNASVTIEDKDGGGNRCIIRYPVINP
ncbi:MAG: PocR ligand-binding domain-containing protein [Deltaproteobacteria bacterium]|jgi:ligand-binding sensor protein|nr:PocR ligand-binding domain-containing protein [Deltaproteobacteria bacterium]